MRANKVDFKGQSYRTYIKEEEWGEFYNNDDPNWLWDFMYKIILKTWTKCAQ